MKVSTKVNQKKIKSLSKANQKYFPKTMIQ